MMRAAGRLKSCREKLAGSLIVAAVPDEELLSQGTAFLAELGVKAQAGIVGRAHRPENRPGHARGDPHRSHGYGHPKAHFFLERRRERHRADGEDSGGPGPGAAGAVRETAA